MLNSTQAIEQDDLNLRVIENSLEKACIKHKKKNIKVSKEWLIYKIVDELKVTKKKAEDYLKILDSRGVIVMINQEIDYTIKDENNHLNL